MNSLEIDIIWEGPGARFVLLGEEDGSFTVMDQLTSSPAVWDNRMLFGVSFEEADSLLETMNELLIAMGRA